MQYQAGDPAPPFEMQTIDGSTISIESLRGRPVFLTFFKWASCPFCIFRIREMKIEYDLLTQHGMHIIGVFHSRAEKLISYTEAKDVPFPIIPDPDMSLYDLYGVERSIVGVGGGLLRLGMVAKMISGGLFKIKPYDVTATAMPANFLIDPDGIIRKAHYGNDIGDHLPFEIVQAFADQYADDANPE